MVMTGGRGSWEPRGGLGLGQRQMVMLGKGASRLAGDNRTRCRAVDTVSLSKPWALGAIEKAVCPHGLELRRKARARDRFEGHEL